MGFITTLTTIEEAEGTTAKELVEKAHTFMKQAHEGQRRIGGDPFYTHPEAVARILVEQEHTNPQLISAALLHDVVEDTPVTLDVIRETFGETIVFLVNGVTDYGEGDGAEHIPDKIERMKQTQKKVLEHGQKDPRVYLIKVADRIHNLRTIDALSEEKQRRIKEQSRVFHKKLATEIGETNFLDQLDSLLKE